MTMREDLEAIRERLARASPGPWISDAERNRVMAPDVRGYKNDGEGYRERDIFIAKLGFDEVLSGEDDRNREFIAAARTDVAVLLEMVDALIEEVADLECGVTELQGQTGPFEGTDAERSMIEAVERLWAKAKRKAGAR